MYVTRRFHLPPPNIIAQLGHHSAPDMLLHAPTRHTHFASASNYRVGTILFTNGTVPSLATGVQQHPPPTTTAATNPQQS